MIYDLAILGGGPAGVAAGVYAARKRLKTVFITKDWGGQSIVSPDIQNWIGTPSVSGIDLAEMLRVHLLTYASDALTIKEGVGVTAVTKNGKDGGGFLVKSEDGEYRARTILVTTGSHRRKLDVPGADRLEHRGITYCASCDGPLFADKDVVVIGGGNAGFETAAQLLAYAKSVALIHRREEFKADPVTVKKVLTHPKMRTIVPAEPVAVKGKDMVTGLVYLDKKTNEKKELAVEGVFVEIGSVPTTEFMKGLVGLDQYGQIVVDPKTQRAHFVTPPETTSDARRGEGAARDVSADTASAAQGLRNEADAAVSGGVWAAGDCTDGLYHQNNIAAGDAVKALEDIYLYLHAK